MFRIGGQERERLIPDLGAKEVLVKIAASGVNPLDTKIRVGHATHARQPPPAVLGLDMARTIEEIGSNVTTFKVGAGVYGMVGGVGGMQGTLAQYIVVAADLLAHNIKEPFDATSGGASPQHHHGPGRFG